MNKMFVIVALVLILGVCQALSLFGGDDEIHIGPELSASLEMAGKEERKLNICLQQYFEKKKVDVDAMRGQRDQMAKSLQFAFDHLDQMTGPDTEVWDEFKANTAACVTHSLKVADKNKDMIDHISKHNPGTDADFKILNELMGDLVSTSKKLSAALANSRAKLKTQLKSNK
ncbi:MAG: hypothetical protein HN350_09380 [Phycisphaerales bacterium]|nr:hypothetical protein [Phycisphaerales bacterium]